MLRWGYDVKRVDSALAASLLSQHSERKRRKANLAKKLSLGSKVVGALSLYRYIPWGMNDNLLEFKGGRVMIMFFINYSTVAFPLHLPTLKRQQFFGAVANSLGKNSYFPLPLDVRRYVAPTGEEVDARQRGVN